LMPSLCRLRRTGSKCACRMMSSMPSSYA
jgi:hypothetical protein